MGSTAAGREIQPLEYHGSVAAEKQPQGWAAGQRPQECGFGNTTQERRLQEYSGAGQKYGRVSAASMDAVFGNDVLVPQSILE